MAIRVAVVLTARPSWAKLEPVCRALKARPDVDLQIIACASALLERYGRAVDVVRAQGYDVAAEVWSTYEGSNLITSAKETGALVSGLVDALSRLRPDSVLLCADRHEILGAATATRFLHLPLVHLQGGERSGSIDDSVRDSVTQLADVHCVCTPHAAYRVYGLTGAWAAIHVTGCPSIDLAHQALQEPPIDPFAELPGTGPVIDTQHPFLVVLQHPVTTEADQAGAQMTATLEAISQSNLPSVLLWPGQDAGADDSSRAIRAFRHQRPDYPLLTIKNLPPTRFLRLLSQAACLVGNSSAGIRESSFLGTPVVDIGTRQWGRQRASNVTHVGHDPAQIGPAIQAQIALGRYPSSDLYGTGDAGERIADVICQQEARCRVS